MSVIFLNKEKGISSYQALREAQKALNFKKAGHAGTLDPIATGLLPIFFDRSIPVIMAPMFGAYGFIVILLFMIFKFYKNNNNISKF